MDLYYFRHFSELNEAAKTKKPKEMSVPVKALIMVTCVLAAPFLMVAGMICLLGFGITGSVHSAVSGEKAYDEIDDDEFSETIMELEDIQRQLTRMQKNSKYYNLVYRYHKVDSFCDPDAKRHTNINIKNQFDSGKLVTPALSVSYYCSDGISAYKNLLKQMPNQDIPYYEGPNEDYLGEVEEAIYKELVEHLIAIGYDTNGSRDKFHEKYPHCDINYTISGDGSWIWIVRKGKNTVKRKRSD